MIIQVYDRFLTPDECNSLMDFYENNKNKSLKQIDDQLIIITNLILSKLSSIPINHEKIKNEINNTKTRTIN